MLPPTLADHEAQPVTAVNPPFLPRIAYRADDYASLRWRLLGHLREAFPGWNERLAENQGTQDLGVTLVELFAYLGDVVGFYQDVRANEAFLRTATLPASLTELAALVDYRPAPGAAASTLQAFLLREGQAGTVPAGFRVRTAAAEGAPSLVFETARALPADAARNTLRFGGYDRSARTLNTPGLPPDAGVALDQAYTGLRAGSFVLLRRPGEADLPVQLTAAVIRDGKTRLSWDEGALPAGTPIPIADLTLHGNPRQAMAPAARARADEITAGDRAVDVASTTGLTAGTRVLFVAPGWMEAARILAAGSGRVTWNRPFALSLRRSQTRIYRATSAGYLHAVVRRGAASITRATNSQPGGPDVEAGDHLLLSDATGVERVLVAGRAGATITLAEPVPRAMIPAPKAGMDPTVELHRVRLPGTGVSGASAHTDVAPVRLAGSETELVMEAAYEGLEPGAALVLHDGQHTRAARLAEAGVDGEGRTVLRFQAPVGAPFRVASLLVHGPFASTLRVDGFNRNEAFTPAGMTRLRIAGSPALKPGDPLVVEGGGRAEGARVAALAPGQAGETEVDLRAPLVHAYPLATTVVYGNVVEASHGETVVDEAVGSGDGSRAGQRFVLRRRPTTWVHDAAGRRGVRSTLEVFVADELWTEVESLAESAADARHYAVEVDDEGETLLAFGDGRHGARLPTGRGNVRARYRVGLGAGGNVPAGAVRVVPEPLEFLESTRNPIPAAGGADAETPDEVRRLAPLTVRTLDRAVSLGDFADLALAYAGIAKARADGGWSRGRRLVQLTVASTGGSPLTPALHEGLRAFLAGRAAPGERFVLRDFRPWPVRLSVEIHVLPQFTRLETLLRVRDALGAGRDSDGRPGYFHFDRRGLGEDLYLSDVYALVEGVRGVDHVVARAFHPQASAAGVLDRIEVPPDALATGGHASDALVGVLGLQATGGVT